jgi:dihydropteroate synthase
MVPAPMTLGRHRIEWSRPVLLGVLNVTEDSFSDGGRFLSLDAAIAHGLALREQGADIVDVGAESTRPGAASVDVELELERVVPVVRALAREGVLVSVDTTKAAVAAAAIDAGGSILNDVSMGDSLDELARVAARSGAGYLRMHARGTPLTMRSDPALSEYPRGVVPEVVDSLRADAATLMAAGVDRSRIMLDPGIGFAKTATQSLALLAAINEVVGLGFAVCVGPSRKSFIDARDAYDPSWGAVASAPHERLGGTAAAVTASILGGAHAVRVHDVALMRQCARVAHAIALGRRASS